jgi:hypothetical protein
MTNPQYIFLLMLTALIVISPVSSATVTNSIHRVNLTPAQTDVFQFTFTPDRANEIGVPMKVSMDEGNCSNWVSVDVKSFNLTTSGTKITATTKVPSDVVNGYYVCTVVATAPAQGMVSMAIGVPLKINITGGKEPTPTPTQTNIVSHAETPTPAAIEHGFSQDNASGVSNYQNPVGIEKNGVGEAPVGKPEGIPTSTIAAAIAGLLVMSFCTVGVYDAYRGRKRR